MVEVPASKAGGLGERWRGGGGRWSGISWVVGEPVAVAVGHHVGADVGLGRGGGWDRHGS